MPEFIDLTGHQFQGFFVLRKSLKRGGVKKRIMWICKCSCGKEVEVYGEELKRGQKYCKYCVPKGRPSHNLSHLPEYQIWSAIKQRCRNKEEKAYQNYGARGIDICDRWFNSFEYFLADMGRRPRKELTIERLDNDGDYEPDNCIWATRKQQARNFRSNRLIEYNGGIKCISEWAEVYGLNHAIISSRLDRGWSVENAITKKPRSPSLIKYQGKLMTHGMAEKLLGFSSGVIHHRLKRGYTHNEVISTPLGG